MESIAVLIPCYNEEATIYEVVRNFQVIIPQAQVYVYDNCSQDKTYDEAVRAGAIVRIEKKLGKGNVVKSMFKDVDADIYVITDGDMTYEVSDVVKMIELLKQENLDMVVAARKTDSPDAYPACHAFGNKVYNIIMKLMFGGDFTDIFSGFRVMSKDFVKSFKITSEGFDIEAEMTVHSIVTHKRCKEIQSKYYKRPSGSYSKLSTIKDGIRVLFKMLTLFKNYKLQHML